MGWNGQKLMYNQHYLTIKVVKMGNRRFFSAFLLMTSLLAADETNSSFDRNASFEFSREVGGSLVDTVSVQKSKRICSHLVGSIKSPIFNHLVMPEESKQFYTSFCKFSAPLAWFDTNLTLGKQAEDLISMIAESYDHGLNPNKYHYKEIQEHLNTIKSGSFATADEKAAWYNRMDILLTDSYMSLSYDLYYGFTDWERFKRYHLMKKNGEKMRFEWSRPKKEILYPQKYLTENLSKKTILLSLRRLNPDFNEYRRLLDALKSYRQIHARGGWERIPFGGTIRYNYTDNRIPLLKKRLYAGGELSVIENLGNTHYNEPSLIRAVKTFQTLHNLPADGYIGKKTIQALNVTVEEKIKKIILNLERFRWINQSFDKNPVYISVNIPAYRMQLLEYGKEVMSMNVIVGKKERPTPVLSSYLYTAVLNPSWTAPKTIVKEDILGKENVDEYLESHDMKVYAYENGERIEVDTQSVDWKSYAGREDVPFTFRADAGKANPLGEVKFLFPNKYSVYLHDTNQRYLFQNNYRALSSGCVRLAKPLKLLTYLTQKEDKILTKEIAAKKRTDQFIPLKKKIPVVLRYMTVGVDENNKTYFYDDIYGHDERHLFSVTKNHWTL